MSIGMRIKELRTAKGISQQKLANALDLSVDMIRSVEINRSNPSLDTLLKLADFFECTVDYLLERTDIPTKEVPIIWEDFQRQMKFLSDMTRTVDPEQADRISDIISRLPDNDTEITGVSLDKVSDILRTFANSIEKAYEAVISDNNDSK